MSGKNDRRARERVAALRAAQRRAERRRTWIFGITMAVIVVVAAAGITWLLVGRARNNTIAGVRTFTGLARDHVTGKVHYAQTPPVGGAHNAVWLNCGIYPTPVPNENAVHDMEHGAVWITYSPSLPAGSVTHLQALVRGEPATTRAYLDLSPYPGLPAPVVASAWGTQLRLTGANDPRLGRFITKYVQGPQTPEPGASCSGGGVGNPTP